MVKGLFLRSAALAAMVAAGMFTVPAMAQDVDRTEMRAQRMERQAARQEARQQQAPQQAQQAPRQAQQAPRQARQEYRLQRQAQAQAQGVPQQRAAPQGGWRSQRSAEGTRNGRDWNRGSAVVRPAPATNGAVAQVPQWGNRDRTISSTGTSAGSVGQRDRNRSYTDGTRNGTYRDANRDGGRDTVTRNTGTRDTVTRNRDGSYRSGYRDGRTADSYRDNRQQRQTYREGYRTGSRDTYRSGSDHRRWNNDWRRDNRYNWSGYRNQNRNVFSVGRYYSPYRNYNYSRLSIGLFLDSGFYGNNYWVNDPWQYRLPEEYGPYKWVRYYDDVILVDIYTGEVVDVIHDFFY